MYCANSVFCAFGLGMYQFHNTYWSSYLFLFLGKASKVGLGQQRVTQRTSMRVTRASAKSTGIYSY